MASKKIKSFTLPSQKNHHQLNQYKSQYGVSTLSTYYQDQNKKQQQQQIHQQQQQQQQIHHQQQQQQIHQQQQQQIHQQQQQQQQQQQKYHRSSTRRTDNNMNSSTKTRYTRQQPRKSDSMLKMNRGASNNYSLPNTERRSFREIDSSTGYRMGQSIRRATKNKSNNHNNHNSSNLELDDLTTDIPIERINCDGYKNNNNNNSSFTNNAYDDDDDVDEDGRRMKDNTRNHKNHTSNDHIYTSWYNGPRHSKYGQLNYNFNSNNTNMDLLSLHSILNRNNKARTNKNVWIGKLAYSFVGVLTWIFITLCIEELDETPHSSSLKSESCNPNQEIRYWASYVCLVAIVTGATIYFEKSNASECILFFLLNAITFVSINKAPLSCICNRGTLVEQDIERLRGGFLLFMILTVLAIWITKKFVSLNKTS